MKADPAPADSFRATFASRWTWLSVATLLYWGAAHSLRPLVPLRLSELGAGDAEIGLIVAAYSLLPLFLAIPGGQLADRLGASTVLVGGFVGMGVVGVGYALATSSAQILVLQLGMGVAELGVWIALQSLISHAGTGRFQDRHLSLFSLAWGVGMSVGPSVGSLAYEHLGFPALGWIYTIGALAALAPSLAAPRPSHAVTGDPAQAGPVARHAIELGRRPEVTATLTASFATAYLNSIQTSFYPLLLERAGLSVAEIGLLLSTIAVSSLLVRVALPLLQRRLSDAVVLLWGTVIATVAMALTPWGTFALPLLFLGAAVFGAAFGVGPPLTVKLMAASTGAPERGLAMGVRLTANRLALVSQPVVFGGMAAAIGMSAAFPLSGGLLLGLAAVTGRRLKGVSPA